MWMHMNEEKSTIGGQNLAPTKGTPNYLEQLGNEVINYRDLLANLRERLNVVSERMPAEPNDNPDENTREAHISTIVIIMGKLNRDLNKIIDEIAL